MDILFQGLDNLLVKYPYLGRIVKNNYLPIHIIFERLEAVSVLNIWRVIRCNICQNSELTSLGPVAL